MTSDKAIVPLVAGYDQIAVLRRIADGVKEFKKKNREAFQEAARAATLAERAGALVETTIGQFFDRGPAGVFCAATVTFGIFHKDTNGQTRLIERSVLALFESPDHEAEAGRRNVLLSLGNWGDSKEILRTIAASIADGGLADASRQVLWKED